MRIVETDDGTRVTAPAGFRGSAAGWGFVTFLLWSLTALPLALGALVSRAVGAPGAPPTLFSGMVVAFLPFGLFGIFLVVWAIGGSEDVSVSDGVLTVGRRVFGVPLGGRRYDTMFVERLRVAPHPYMRAWNPWAPLLGGVVAFDYGAMTYRFGTGLSGDDAVAAVAALAAGTAHAGRHERDRPARTVAVPKTRCRVEERSDSLVVTMPYDYRLLPRPLWYILAWVPLSALMVGAGVAVTAGSPTPVFVGGAISVVVVAMLVVTQGSFIRLNEVIEITPSAELFERRIEYWGFRSSGTRLNLGYVRNLRVELPSGGDVARAYADMAQKRSGPLAVDFGDETYRFGLWTSEADIRRVVGEITRRYPATGA